VSPTLPPSPAPSADKGEVTVERLEAAIHTVAYVMDRHNDPGYAPLLDRLEKELAYYREGRDPLSRARAILNKS
jgi:hypothetical protein